MKFLVLIGSLLFAAQAFALDYNDCKEEVRSPALKKAVEAGFEGINRMDTPYTYGLNVTSKSAPLVCSYDKSSQEIIVFSQVNADAWSEEGSVGEISSGCFLTLEKADGEWIPEFLQCEDFQIEEDL
jgi:hypothetical protein